MAWLIEAYESIDETSAEDLAKAGTRLASKMMHNGTISQKDAEAVANGSAKAQAKAFAAGVKHTKDAMKDKGIKQAYEHKYGNSKIQNIKDTIAAAKGDKDALEKGQRQATDLIYAKDAKERHERRHPELKKAANECALIIEILQ